MMHHGRLLLITSAYGIVTFHSIREQEEELVKVIGVLRRVYHNSETTIKRWLQCTNMKAPCYVPEVVGGDVHFKAVNVVLPLQGDVVNHFHSP
jgi:hypothetical protein